MRWQGVSRIQKALLKTFCEQGWTQMDLARQAATKYLNLSIHRRDAETRRKAKKDVWHADELDGGGPSCRSVCGRAGVCPCEGAERAEGAEEKGACRQIVAARDDSAH